MDDKKRIGFVSLVGAGPGDPGLLTLRGAALLAAADVVVYDYLANAALLRHCPNAKKIYVGKKAAEHTFTQERINALLVELGLDGNRVVRLKGGDPFVFGRGGEECEAMAAAGIGFEVVPGITAALAAPAYAGIPVTHRDFNSSFTFITGHEKEGEYRDPRAVDRGAAEGSSDIDWAAVAKLPAMAFYMGVKALPRICAKLIEHGMDPAMPAATIRWGTRPEQRTVTGTIADLPDRVAEAKLAAPALTIIGKVVGLRDTMNWFEKRPLFGKTVIVTRTRQQSSELADQLAELGAAVIEAPTIELAPADDIGAVDAAIADAGSYDWIIFTSRNGVAATRQRLEAMGRDVRALGDAKIAAVGRATATALEEILCLRADLCPKSFIAEALADELASQGEIAGKRHLLLRADIARPVLAERLESGGSALVSDVAVYRTRCVAELDGEVLAALDDQAVDWVTFTSSSTARNFFDLLGGSADPRLAGVKLASIGPVTTTAMVEMGRRPTVEASESTLAGLVAAIARAEK